MLIAIPAILLFQYILSRYIMASVRKEDQHSLDQLKSTFKAMYNDVTRHPWGGGIMGLKTQRKLEKREKALAEELAKRSQV